jgi:hypothetical protein
MYSFFLVLFFEDIYLLSMHQLHVLELFFKLFLADLFLFLYYYQLVV